MRSLTLKNWFLLASVSCGVGFGSTFLISQNLQQSAWAGLGTVPAIAASLTILSRQRKEEIDRQVAKLKSSLDSLEGQERLARERLQLTQSNHQQIDLQVQELHRKQTKLTTIGTELAQIEAKRQFTIDSAQQSDLDLQSIRNKIHQDSATKKQLELQILTLQSEWQRLRDDIASKELYRTDVKQQISSLKDEKNLLSTAVSDLERLIQLKQALQQNLDLDLEKQRILGIEISSLQQQKQEHQVSLDELERILDVERDSISELNSTLTTKQRQLDRIVNKLTEIEAIGQSAIDSTEQLELTLQQIYDEISKHSTIKARLEVEVDNFQERRDILQERIVSQEVDLTELDRNISQRKEERDQLSISLDDLKTLIKQKESLLRELDWVRDSTGIRIIEPLASWEDHFQNDPHLPILRYIDKYDRIGESEIHNILQNYHVINRLPQRAVANQFPRKIREYNTNNYLPFLIKVEQLVLSG
jgi:chromosome segregation ATPase